MELRTSLILQVYSPLSKLSFSNENCWILKTLPDLTGMDRQIDGLVVVQKTNFGLGYHSVCQVHIQYCH